MKIIARIKTDFPTKFGIPRQSGLVENLKGKIVFEPEYRNPDALNGLEGFSHIWLLWGFSENPERSSFRATVRPPRLGENRHLGVFATRSPFRPNGIGLSCVRIENIIKTPNEGTVIEVRGADMVDGTPIYDIKPYIPYTDCISDASGGFTEETKWHTLTVVLKDNARNILPEDKEKSLIGILSEDPRPAYQKKDPERIYGFPFAGHEVKFQVKDDVLTVLSISCE